LIKIILQWIVGIGGLFLFSTHIWAANIFSLVVVNSTNQSLKFNGASDSLSHFYADRDMLFPGGNIIITAEVAQDDDLVGNIHFTDGDNYDNVLVVHDYRQFHPSRPVFLLKNSRFKSEIEFLVFNPVVDGRGLDYIGATVDIGEAGVA
jgi:hypothetical protein